MPNISEKEQQEYDHWRHLEKLIDKLNEIRGDRATIQKLERTIDSFVSELEFSISHQRFTSNRPPFSITTSAPIYELFFTMPKPILINLEKISLKMLSYFSLDGEPHTAFPKLSEREFRTMYWLFCAFTQIRGFSDEQTWNSFQHRRGLFLGPGNDDGVLSGKIVDNRRVPYGEVSKWMLEKGLVDTKTRRKPRKTKG